MLYVNIHFELNGGLVQIHIHNLKIVFLVSWRFLFLDFPFSIEFYLVLEMLLRIIINYFRNISI